MGIQATAQPEQGVSSAGDVFCCDRNRTRPGQVYSLILDSLYAAANKTTVNEQEAYLRTLRPMAKALRGVYHRFASPTVQVSYKQPATQAVYMLRYFPLYAT